MEVGALSDQERTSPRRVLLAAALAVGAHVVEHADTCRVLMEARTLAAYNPQIAAAVEASADRNRRQLRDLFQAGVHADEWPRDTEPDLAALMFTTGLYGLMAQWHLRPGSFTWESAAALLVGASPRTGRGRAAPRPGQFRPRSPAGGEHPAAGDRRMP